MDSPRRKRCRTSAAAGEPEKHELEASHVYIGIDATSELALEQQRIAEVPSSSSEASDVSNAQLPPAAADLRSSRRTHVCVADLDLPRVVHVLEDLCQEGRFQLCSRLDLQAAGTGKLLPVARCPGLVGAGCGADAVIFFVSRHSTDDATLTSELDSALDRSVRLDVYPVVADSECPIGSMVSMLKENHQALCMRLSPFQWTAPFAERGKPGYASELDAFARALGEPRARNTHGQDAIAADKPVHSSRAPRAPVSTWFSPQGALAPNAPEIRIFISYAHVDGARVEAVKEQLEQRGLSCWFDKMQLTAGVRWVDEVALGVIGCTHLVLFASKVSVSSPYCEEEVALAVDERKEIVVCYVDSKDVVKDHGTRALRMRLPTREYCSLLESAAETAAELEQRIRNRSGIGSALPSPVCANCAVDLGSQLEHALPTGEGRKCRQCERPLAIRGDLRFAELFGTAARPADDLEHLLQAERHYALEIPLATSPSSAVFTAQLLQARSDKQSIPKLAVEVFKGADSGPVGLEEWASVRRALARAAWVRLHGVPTIWDSSVERRAIACTLTARNTVQDEISRGRFFADDVVASFLEQMALILHALHMEAMLLHHNISVSTVLMTPLDRTPSHPQFMLRNLGLASPFAGEKAELRKGVPVFAPLNEDAPASSGPEHDILCAGIVALSMLAQRPYAVDDIGKLQQELERNTPPPRSSRQLRLILFRCIKDGPERIRSACQLWAVVHACSPSILPQTDFTTGTSAFMQALVQDRRDELRRFCALDRSDRPAPALSDQTLLVAVKVDVPAERVDPCGVFDVLRRTVNRAGAAVALSAAYVTKGIFGRFRHGSAILEMHLPQAFVEALMRIEPAGQLATSLAECGLREISCGEQIVRLPEVTTRVRLEWAGDAYLLDGFCFDHLSEPSEGAGLGRLCGLQLACPQLASTCPFLHLTDVEAKRISAAVARLEAKDGPLADICEDVSASFDAVAAPDRKVGPAWTWATSPDVPSGPLRRALLLHARKDERRADELVRLLESTCGLSCWVSGDGALDDIAMLEAKRALCNCTAVIFLASKHSVVSGFCQEQFVRAFDSRHSIVVLYEESRGAVEAHLPETSSASVTQSVHDCFARLLRIYALPSLELGTVAAAAAAGALKEIVGTLDAEAQADLPQLRQGVQSSEIDDIERGWGIAISKFARSELCELARVGMLADCTYVPPEAAEGPNQQPAGPLADLVERFLGGLSSRPALLLAGEPGTSKSSFLHSLHRASCRAWADRRPADREARPVTVLLRQDVLRSSSSESGGLRQHVESVLGGSAVVQELRNGPGLVVLCDGYDEMGEAAAKRVNLWDANDMDEWASGLIVTCRTEFLGLGSRHEVWFAPGGTASRLKKLWTCGFSEKQRQTYLQLYCARVDKRWTVERYEHAINSMAGLSAFAARPYTLSMLVRVLPETLELTIRAGSRAVFEAFAHYLAGVAWRSATRHSTPLGQATYNALQVLHRRACYQLCLHAAASAFQYDGELDDALARLRNRRPGRSVLLEGCPFTFKASAATGRLSWSFPHKTLYDYFLAECLYIELMQGKSRTSVSLGASNFVHERTLISFIAERVPRNEALQTALLDSMQNTSSSSTDYTDRMAEWRAANAATILVAGQFSFARRCRDLGGVHLVDADLWRMEAAGVSFRGAVLERCALHEANLAGADLREATLRECVVNAHPMAIQAFTALLSSFAVSSESYGTHKWIVTGGYKEGRYLEVWRSRLEQDVLAVDDEEEKQLPQQQEHELQHQVLEGHNDWVLSVAMNSSGTRIASSSKDGTVRVWAQNELWYQKWQGNHEGAVRSVAMTPDGSLVVSCGDDTRVKVWDGNSEKSGKVLWALESGVLLGKAFCMAVSPNGERAACGTDGKSVVHVWSLRALKGHSPEAQETRDKGDVLEGHQRWVRSVAFSQDGTRLLSGSQDCTVRLWDVSRPGAPAALGEVGRHTNSVRCVAFALSPEDGHESRAVSCGGDQMVRVWDLARKQEVARMQGHTGPVLAVAPIEGGRRLLSASSDQTVRVWNVDGSTAAWPTQGHANWVLCLAVSRDGSLFATGSNAGGGVRLWDAESGEELLAFAPPDGPSGDVRSVSLSADGSVLASGGREPLGDGGAAVGVVRLYDARARAQRLRIVHGSEGVVAVSLSADGSRVASGSGDARASVRLWDASAGRLLLPTLGADAGPVSCLALSAEGRTLVVAGLRDGPVRAWSATTGEHLWQLRTEAVQRGPAAPAASRIVSSVAVASAADGRYVALGCSDHGVRLLECATGEIWASPPADDHSYLIHAIAISEDGTCVASCSDDRTVRVWRREMDSRELRVSRLKGHSGSVWGVGISADGARVISGSNDHTVRVWETVVCAAESRGENGPESAAGARDDPSVAAYCFCDFCSLEPMLGGRWKCTSCPNIELCAECKGNARRPEGCAPSHEFEKVEPAHPLWDAERSCRADMCVLEAGQPVWRTIRRIAKAASLESSGAQLGEGVEQPLQSVLRERGGIARVQDSASARAHGAGMGDAWRQRTPPQAVCAYDEFGLYTRYSRPGRPTLATVQLVRRCKDAAGDVVRTEAVGAPIRTELAATESEAG